MPDWSRKAAVKRTRKRLNKIRGAVLAGAIDIAGDWSDQDQYICTLCDELTAALSERIAAITEALEEEPDDK